MSILAPISAGELVDKITILRVKAQRIGDPAKEANVRKELALLYQDVGRPGDRVSNLDRHFGQAAKDLEEIRISAEKAGKRARRLDNFDFEELAPETPTMIGAAE